METMWVGLALLGGTLQVVRNGASRALTGEMSVHGVNLVRFLFALPFALGVMALLWSGHRLPGDPGGSGLLLALAAGAAQAAGNGFMVSLLGKKNFAVAITLAKTEAVLAALFGVLLFSQSFSAAAWTAVALATVGVVLASSRKAWAGKPDMKAVVAGVASGSGYALSFLFAAEALARHTGGHPAANVAQVLLIMLAFQVTTLGGWIWLKSPEDYRAMKRRAKTVWTVGASGAFATMCWFGASLYVPVALVKTVGQVEFLLAVLVSWKLLGERPGRGEALGMLLVLAGILLLLSGR